MTDHPRLARIRALLDKAEDSASTQAEAELFFAKATELMAKHGIDEAMLNASRPADQQQKPGDRIFTCTQPYAMDKTILLSNIASALGCRAIRLRGRGDIRLHVFGMNSDLERLDLLFTSLLIQAMTFLGRQPLPADPVRKKVYKRDWLQGYTVEVRHRLIKIEQRAQEDAQAGTDTGPSVALVMADRRSLVDQALTAAYPSIRTTQRNRFVGAGYERGRQDGRQADLGQSRTGGNSRQALS